MILLPRSSIAWGTPDFEATLKQEIACLGARQLPLQQGLATGSVALDDKIDVMLISAIEKAGCIRAKVGVFYASVIAGCNCADDPTPVEAQPEYCVVEIGIDKTTAETVVTLLAE